MQQLPDETKSSAERSECASLVIETVLLGMRTLRAEMRRNRPVDLSVPQFRILAFLKRREGASLSDLAEHQGLSLPSISRMIDGLVQRGLVRREDSRQDRRRVILALTEEGRQTFESVAETARARMAEKLDSLSAEESAAVAEAMRLLRAALSTSEGR